MNGLVSQATLKPCVGEVCSPCSIRDPHSSVPAAPSDGDEPWLQLPDSMLQRWGTDVQASRSTLCLHLLLNGSCFPMGFMQECRARLPSQRWRVGV